MHPTAALILLGGRSSRMGTPKHEVLWQGRPLLARAEALLHSLSLPIYLSCRPDQKPDTALPQLHDLHPNIGPLGGIHAALSSGLAERWLILPVDEVGADRELLEALLVYEGVVTPRVQDAERLEGFPSVWPASALPAVEEVIASKDYAVWKVLRSLGAEVHEVEPGVLRNLNRPQDVPSP